jgi:hydroxyethylthiazole kinase-like uncharacterized protein yjeF
MKLLLSSWMRELDSATINQIGFPSIVLMENASQGAATFFSRELPQPQYKHVILFIGKGNNGGDGLAVGRILSQRGYSVEFILLTAPDKLNPDPKINFDIIEKLDLSFSVIEKSSQVNNILKKYSHHDAFIVDAVLGTGINKPVREGLFAHIFKLINDSDFPVAAIDIPSGLSDSFLPQKGVHVKADVTATFQCLKTSHIFPDGNKYCGKINIIDIGIPNQLIDQDNFYINMINPANILPLFSPREVDSHKGDFGHCLNISGSIEKPGAGILSAYSILKSGAGLCTSAVKAENRSIAVTRHPELMTLIYKENTDLLEGLKEFDCILMGPGMNDHDDTFQLVQFIFQHTKVPLVLDADAINVISTHKEILEKQREFPLIITPHPGEFSRLVGLPSSEILEKRIEISKEFSEKYNVYLILKGHHTIIAAPNGQIFVNQTGNPGMATAGSGDVLSGIITGMISQFFPKYSLDMILQASIFIHGYSGDLAVLEKGEICLTADDLIRFLPSAILKLNDFNTQFQFSHEYI